MDTVAVETNVLRRQYGVLEDGRVTTVRCGRVQGSRLLIEEVTGMPFSLLEHLSAVLKASGYREGDRIHLEINMKRKL